MADLTSNAQLSAPQGAGATPLPPVQKQDMTRQMVSGFANIFESVGGYRKAEQDKAKAQDAEREAFVLKSYASEENKIAQLLEQGSITPAEAGARSRVNFRVYSTNYGDLTPKLEQVAKGIKGQTVLGEAEKEIEMERQTRIKDRDDASKAGFIFTPGMDRATEDAQVKAHKTGVIEAERLKERRAQAAEERAQGTYDAQVDAKREKDASFTAINNIAGAHLEAYQAFVVSNGKSVSSGQMSPDVARALNMERLTNISSAIQAAARVNPELAAPYRSIFEEISKAGDKLLDPKVKADDLQNELNLIKNKAKLLALQDPKVKAAVITLELMPNTPTAILLAGEQAQTAFTRIATTPVDSKDFVPQVVGNPEVEKPTLDLLKHAIKDISSKKADKQQAAMDQASNSVNQILKQAGKYIDEGVDPKNLKELASFFASPEYAVIVNNGKIDAQAAATAKKVIQLNYEKVMIEGVNTKLSGYLFDPKDRQGKPSPFARIAIKDAINVRFTGSGVVFEPKPINEIYGNTQPPALDIERRRQSEVINELKTAQKAVNQLIHMGAHMEGTINYAKYWEANKHILMPGVFPPPEQPKKQEAAPAAPAPVPPAPPASSGKNWWED